MRRRRAAGVASRHGCVLACLLALASPCSASAQADWPVLPGVGRPDHRVVVDPNALPWRAIGRVQTELGGRCTGFLVGPRSVVTAAHCLYLSRPRHYIQPSSVHFVVGYSFGTFVGHAVATRFVVAPGYDPSHGANTAGADWAVLTLAAPLGTADRILPLQRSEDATGAVALGGYSRDRAEVLDADPDCKVSGRTADREGRPLLVHTCAATGGTSGAPLLARAAGGEWEAIGMQISAAPDHAGGLAVPASAIRLSDGGSESGGAERVPSVSAAAPWSAAAGAHRSR